MRNIFGSFWGRPVTNAILAALYIVVLVFAMTTFVDQPDKETSLLAPITVISLLTLSVAVMGYLFFGKPVMLYIDGQKREAVHFFLKTIAGFAVITLLFLVGVSLGLFA